MLLPETGSGKSTQLPAYILEDNPSGAKIVVAQPRRLAATGVATRVAEERGERTVGTGAVGYIIQYSKFFRAILLFNILLVVFTIITNYSTVGFGS